MKKITVCFMVFFIAVVFNATAMPIAIDYSIYGERFDILTDIIVSKDSEIIVDKIYMNDSLYIQNNGTIAGNIFIADGISVLMQNSGDIIGGITIGANSQLTQVIEKSDDIKRLNVMGPGFSILVHNKNTLNLSDILLIAVAAEKITLYDSEISLGKNAPVRRADFSMRSYNGTPQIELIGKILIKLDALDIYDKRLIMSNVSGDGIVSIEAPDLDILYTAKTYIENGNLYLGVFRETDYQKIIGGARGEFINTIRAGTHKNKIITAMDNAKTIRDINNIMEKSVMFNPINLMKPIKIFNNFESRGFYNRPETGIDAIYIKGDSAEINAAKLSISNTINNIDFGASFYAGTLSYLDDLNDFSSDFIGADIRAFFELDSLWIDSAVGYNISRFNTDVIFDGKNSVYNPIGKSIYGHFDMGLKYKFMNDFYISPFIGISAQNAKILNQSSGVSNPRSGVFVGTRTEANGITNDYQLFGNIQTDGAMTFGARIKFWSISDDAGGGVSYSFIKSESFDAQKISADLKFLF